MIRRFISKLFSPKKHNRIVKVVIEKGGHKVIFENGVGDHHEFFYDGHFWHYYETRHMVEDRLVKRLEKHWRRWIKKYYETNRRDK